MSRKTTKRNTKKSRKIGLKAYEKNKFLLGSAFVLATAGFVIYKSTLAESNVLGVYASRLAERREVERVNVNREVQEGRGKDLMMKGEGGSRVAPPHANTESTVEVKETKTEQKDNSVSCPINEKETRMMTRDDCRDLLEKRRMQMAETQRMKVEAENEDEDHPEQENERTQMMTRVEIGEDGMKLRTGTGSGVRMVRDLTKSEEASIRGGLAVDGAPVRVTEDKKVIVGDQVKARIDLPVALDTSTNQLVVTTSDGEKPVAVLPEQAVAALGARGIIGQLNDDGSGVQVVDENGEPVYKVSGTEQRRFLGVLPVEFRSEYKVSAVDGSVSQGDVGLVTRLFRIFSF